MNVTINQEQELFVVGNEQGYSCMGFDNVYIQASELTRRLYPDPQERPLIFEGEKGHLRQYQQYQELIAKAAAQGGIQDTWFHPQTPEEHNSGIANHSR